MLTLNIKNSFKKDVKKCLSRGLPKDKLDKVVKLLQQEEALSEIYSDHSLIGNWKGYGECHIAPDWLLVYRIDESELELVLARTRTHSDIFR